MSLKLLPMLGVPSLPSFLDFCPGFLGLILASSARWFGLSGPGLRKVTLGASLAELAMEELASAPDSAGSVSCFAVGGLRWRCASEEVPCRDRDGKIG